MRFKFGRSIQNMLQPLEFWICDDGWAFHHGLPRPTRVCERSSTNPRGSFGPGEAYTAGNVRDFGYGTSSLCVVEFRY